MKLNREWKSSSVPRKTKIRQYKTLVKPVLMYGCETRKMNEGDAKKIDVFQNRCLRRIMKIKWQDRISNRELLERADVERLSEEVRIRRWRFIGHILRQQPDKNNLAAHSRKGEVQSRVAVLERGAHCSARQESMESTCGGPMRQLGARGQVKVMS